MQQPSYSPEESSTATSRSSAPPLPVLGQHAPLPEMTWETAPSAIHDARLLCFLSAVLSACAALVSLFLLRVGEGVHMGTDRLIFNVLLYGALCGGSLGFARILRQRVSYAWIMQIILSVLGLLLFPIGTLLHALLLARWFHSDVRSWFNR